MTEDKPPEQPKEAPKQLSPEEIRIAVTKRDIRGWNDIVHNARVARAKARGLFSDPCVEPTDAELRAAIVLPGDRQRMVTFAQTRSGRFSWPKADTKDRKKRHFTKRQLMVKASALRFFKDLFNNHASKLLHEATAKEEQFNGVPQADLSKLGAHAAILAEQHVRRNLKLQKRRKRRQQDLSRRINYGLMPGNTNTKKYIRRGESQ